MLTLAFEKLHLERIKISADNRHFIGEKTHRRFTPLGFNYDHDESFRLLEDYWHDEWEKVEKDFVAMRAIGANVIRIHLQLGKFLLSPDALVEGELQQLDRLVELAKSLGLYLDLVGLGCYHGWDVPDWYNAMDYRERWDVQAMFWETLAARYAHEAAIFCFDLMNEPVVPGRKRDQGAWLGAEFAGKTYIQFITLDGTQQPNHEVALAWIEHLSKAIRRHDTRRMITVGLVDWSLKNSRIKSGFFPERIAHAVDFISAHLYPEYGKPEEMLKKLNGFCVGKPVLIDETFHLKCSIEEQEWFLREAAKKAQGFFGFYTDSQSPPEDPFERVSWHDTRHRVVQEWISIFRNSAPFFRRR
jgi:hypothetical protein